MTAMPTYLVTGAGGGVGGVGRTVVEELLASGQTVRAMVHREDDRAEALRESGAEVVVGDLTDPVAVAVALDGVTRMFFSMSVSASYLEATTVVCSLAADMADLDVLVNMSQMTVSQMTPTSTSESHHQRLHWLAEHVIDWSPIPTVQIRPTVFLENPLFTLLAARSIREQSVLALPFGDGRTSPIAAGDVADAVSAVLRDPARTHRRRVRADRAHDSWTSTALPRNTATLWAEKSPDNGSISMTGEMGSRTAGLDHHVQEHITTMARLHREDRYNRSTDQVQALTGHPPQSVEDFVRAHRELFA